MSGHGGDRSAAAAANGKKVGRPTNASKLAANGPALGRASVSGLFAAASAPTVKPRSEAQAAAEAAAACSSARAGGSAGSSGDSGGAAAADHARATRSSGLTPDAKKLKAESPPVAAPAPPEMQRSALADERMPNSSRCEQPDGAPGCGSAMDALLAGLIGKLNLGVERSATMLSDRFGASTRALTQTMVTEVASLRSDMRVEVATLRRESIKAVTALLDDVAAQRKSLADERKEFAKSKQLASNRHWLVLLPSGKYICLTCEIHHHSLQPHEHGSRFMDSPFLQRNGGLMVDANFEQRVSRHECSTGHVNCCALEDSRQARAATEPPVHARMTPGPIHHASPACPCTVRAQAEPLQFALRLQEVEADAVTRRIFRTVLDSILHYRSFLEHESICFLQSENGVEMGDRLHSRRTAASVRATPVLASA